MANCPGFTHIQSDPATSASILSAILTGAPHLRDIFYRMGLSDKDIVALSQALDEEAFFRDYAESHKKLSELGFTTSSSKIVAKGSTILAQGAVGVAICAAVVILGYFYEVRKRM